MDHKDDDYLLVADVDLQGLISIVKFDLRGKAPGHDTITREPLRLAIGTPLYIHLVKLFPFLLRIGYVPMHGN